MPKIDFSAMDEALKEMDEIGMRGWEAKRAYVRGQITLEELEVILEDQLARRGVP